jgi:hypothetical protein
MRGQRYEGVAFQFCKVATVALIAGKYALPVSAVLCAAFYVLAFMNGKRDTRCIGRYPLAIAAFWLAVAGVWILGAAHPGWFAAIRL